MRGIGLVTFVAFLACGSAQADWQYTKWGMSVEDVRAASKGGLTTTKAQDVVLSGKSLKLVGKYVAGNHQFTASMFFDSASGGLAAVRLSQSSIGECKSTSASLAVKYGGGIQDAHGQTVWRDDGSGNQIIYDASKSGDDIACTVMYRPIGIESGL